MTSLNRKIPFHPLQRVPGKNANRPDRTGCYFQVLNLVLDLNLGSFYKLGKLLDPRSGPHYVYRWRDLNHSVSPLYLSRMLYLFHLKVAENVDFEQVQRIDWASGEIVWRKGVMDELNNRSRFLTMPSLPELPDNADDDPMGMNRMDADLNAMWGRGPQ